MNNYYSGNPQTPNMVFDNQLGYVSVERLQKRAVRQDVNRMCLCLLSFFVVSFLYAVVYVAAATLGGASVLSSSTGVYISSALLTILGLPLPFVLYLLFRKLDFRKLISFQPVKGLDALLFIVGGLGLALAINFPIQWLSELLNNTGLQGDTPQTAMADTAIGYVFMFLATAVFPGFFEEFVFRGIILSSLRKYGDGFAVVTSAAIFGLLHQNLVGAIFAFLVGLFLGFIYVKTNNIWIPIAIHFLNNAYSVLQQWIGAWLGDTGSLISVFMFYGIVILGIVCFIVLLRRKKLLGRLNPPQAELPGIDPQLSRQFPLRDKTSVIAAISNPGAIIFASLCLFSILSYMFGGL